MMTDSDDNSSDNSEPEIPEDKTLQDYTEEELAEMDEFDRAALEKAAQAKARWEREQKLEVLRSGLKEVQIRIKRILELQKNMGRFPDVDGKAAISYCISALARHNDEKAIRNALTACLNYLKMQREREEYEIAEDAKKKALEAEEAANPKKKGLFGKKKT